MNNELIDDFITEHIELINSGINSSDLKTLLEQFSINKVDLRNRLIHNATNYQSWDSILTEFSSEECNFTRSKITEIANKHSLYKPDVEKRLESMILAEFNNVYETSDKNSVVKGLFDDIGKSIEKYDEKYRFIKSKISSNFENFLSFGFSGGFSANLDGVEAGLMLANGGDGAQFVFIGRAILAGFNCSNVDVRSSRYDAVIDYKGQLFKIQVKGRTSKSIQLKDRDRGGQGIDTRHERNIGRIISSDDCDILVFIDKSSGMCHLLPMFEIDDRYTDEEKSKSINIETELEEYKENWDIIKKVYDHYIQN